MILDKEVEVIKKLSFSYTPLQTVRIYRHFVDLYSDKHLADLKTVCTEDYLRSRGLVFERYVSFNYRGL